MCRMAAAAGCIVFVNVHLERTVERLSACDSAGLPCEVSDVHVCECVCVCVCVCVRACARACVLGVVGLSVCTC
jgi:hypothetical protein